MNWHRQHKWSGIAAGIFLLFFCLSGLILNHRSSVADIDISRKWLPSRYEYSKWNGGLLRGTTAFGDSILIFGNNGIFISDSRAEKVRDFNIGLPVGADYRQIKNIVVTSDSTCYAASPYGIYILSEDRWSPLAIDLDEERLSDIAVHGDSVIAVGRSNLYLIDRQTGESERITLKPSANHDSRVSLFRMVWLAHSGELFGLAGIVLIDLMAVILIVLTITGFIFWLMPRYIKSHHEAHASKKFLRNTGSLHKQLGSLTIILTLFVAITGWCLRPPVMVPLALTKVSPIPGTSQSNSNPWHDRLRMMRYDDDMNEWLLSTSNGFFTMAQLGDTPVHVVKAPPVSVMGLNILEKDSDGSWLCGSFSGMYRWSRANNTVVDYFTDETAPEKNGPPFGKYAAAGFSPHYNIVCEYYGGTDSLPQPEELSQLPMSLWAVGLEVHSGRMFIGSIATYIYILILGALIFWCLWSGYMISRHKHKSNT